MNVATSRVFSKEPGLSIDICEPGRGRAIGTYRNILLLVCAEPINLAELQDTERSIRKLGERHPSGIGVLMLLNKMSKMYVLPDEERRLVANLLKTGPRIHGAANVYRDTGFAAAVLRGMLTGLTLIARTPVPISLLGSVEAGAEWLLRRLPDDSERPTTAELVAAMSSLEAALV